MGAFPCAFLHICRFGLQAVSLLYESAARSGVNMEMGPALYKVFQDAGLPAPNMRLEMELGHDARLHPMGFRCRYQLSVRRLKSSISRLRNSAISTRYNSGCRRKWHLRTPLCLGLHWWERGAGRLHIKFLFPWVHRSFLILLLRMPARSVSARPTQGPLKQERKVPRKSGHRCELPVCCRMMPTV